MHRVWLSRWLSSRRSRSSRRAFCLSLGEGVALLAAPRASAKKRRKKRCRGGATRCGRGCCSALSGCRAGVCFCTGDEPQIDGKCVDVLTVLIDIIAQQTGLPSSTIGAHPDEPLADQVTIDEATLNAIDAQIKGTFQVAEDVPYYTEGLDAAVAALEAQIKK